jgi:hypothetical protein
VIKSTIVRLAVNVACMGAIRNAYKILVGKPKGKWQLVRPRHGWVDLLVVCFVMLFSVTKTI